MNIDLLSVEIYSNIKDVKYFNENIDRYVCLNFDTNVTFIEA